jgi:tetratricopeptide (TPR) repeat protein
VRDEFKPSERSTLARRVGYRCSNPECGAATSGPGSDHGTAINVGVAAHITAASPGGPRYDLTLTNEQRAAASNGIWLCQTCGKLVDSDIPGYTAELLGRWKTHAERHAAETLGARLGRFEEPLALAVPSLDTDDSLLLFANTSIESVGREKELTELTAFLEDDRSFAWWLWTGPAGVGKSRLAIELCRAVPGAWHAGFLRDYDQQRLGGLRTVAPTLAVVDYAAQRGAWLSDALFELTQHHPGAKVRVLVLERKAAGLWWDTVQRHHRLEEASQVATSMYALPRHLSGLSRDALQVLIRAVATRLGATLSKTDMEDIADHAHHIDSAGTPLFAYVATLDWFSATVSGGRDDALRRLIARADAQLGTRIGEPEATFRAKNVRFLATALGGMSIQDYAALLDTTELATPAALLPGMFEDVHAVPFDELLDGLGPDILGELSVLDRLGGGDREGHAARALLNLGWRTSVSAYSAFVERAASDHRDHPNLLDLFGVERDAAPAEWAVLIAGIIPLLGHSDHPAVAWILDQLEAVQAASGPGSLDEVMAAARFGFATLVFNQDEFTRASQLYSEIVATSDPTWEAHGKALNNRGITWLMLGRKDLAAADFTSVIESTSASEEMRACSLNNRADIYDDQEPRAAVADRTAVLALSETTFNRRYIALMRRGRTLWAMSDRAGAYEDVKTILATDDIAVEQKMAARLERAKWRIAEGRPTEATPDLEAVLRSNRNFENVEAEARDLFTEDSAKPIGQP